MKNELRTTTAMDFYETVSYCLEYEWCSENRTLQESILRLMLEITGQSDSFEFFMEAIEEAACIRVESDILLVNKIGSTSELTPVIIDAKSRLIKAMHISTLRTFNIAVLAHEVEEDAGQGIVPACKLAAIIKWLEDTSASRNVAVEIWKSLAMIGDDFAIKALVFAYDKLGDAENSIMWSEVLSLLEKARTTFSPFVMAKDESEEAERIATMILLISRMNKQSNSSNNVEVFDRAMVYYSLYSKDCFEDKIVKLSSNENFYALYYSNSNKHQKSIGFVSGESTNIA